tara:strand:- start:4267 stop:4581 length:315 start_codon:yes stop_codon:yes gene_type:complete
MLVAIIFIPVTIALIYCLYYNKYNIRFFLPIILITIISGYITYKIGEAFTNENSDTKSLITLIIVIFIFISLWCTEHNIIFKGFGIEKNLNYINNVLFINNRKL